MILFIAILMILLSIILVIYNWQINRNTIFLALFFAAISVYAITHYYVISGKSVFILAVFYNNFTPFLLMAGPFLYFYVRGTLNDSQGLKQNDVFHFIPAIIQTIGITPYYLTPFSYKKAIAQEIINNLDTMKTLDLNFLFPIEFNFFFRTGMLLVYLFYCIYILWKFSPSKNPKNNIPVEQYIISYRWLVSLLAMVAFLLINFFILTFKFLNDTPNHTITNSAIVYINCGIAFSFLGISMLLFPKVLYGMPNYNSEKKNESKTKTSETDIKLGDANSTNLTKETVDETENPFNELAERIQIYLEKEKPYLAPSFSVGDMAIALQVHQNHISYCFNSILKIKFITLKNQLRVAHAIELLVNPEYSNLTIEAIAQKSGFTSRSNFYSIFKTEMGITPNDYLKMESKDKASSFDFLKKNRLLSAKI